MRLFTPLFFLFVVVPIVEVWLLIQVGSAIGALRTLAVIILTAVAGAWLVRQQGMATLRRAQQNLANGIPPTNEILDGVMILGAGLLMLTPGFFTDTLGFLLLLPPTRAVFRVAASGWVKRRFSMQNMTGHPPRASEIEVIDDEDDE